MKDCRVLEEPFLEGRFDEDMEALLKVNELEGMLAGNVDGAFDKGKSSDSATNLIDLDIC